MFKNGANNSFAVKFKGSLLFLNNVKMRCLRQPVYSPTIEWTAEKGVSLCMLSENIKVMRKAKGLSQQELAEKLNVVRQTVSKWEQGVSLR